MVVVGRNVCCYITWRVGVEENRPAGLLIAWVMNAASRGVAFGEEGVKVRGEVSTLTDLVDGPGVAPEVIVENMPSVC